MKEKLYRVRWEIDVYGHNLKEAARRAFKHMQAEGTLATCFEVSPWKRGNFRERGAKWTTIDLNLNDTP